MSTQAQVLANQNNSKSSTGPVTEAGKQVVSGNATKHGLSSPSTEHAVLPGEESAFDKFHNGFVNTYRPVGDVEAAMVKTIAQNYWRLNRAHNMEDALFEQVIRGEEFEGMHPDHAMAKAWTDPQKGLQRAATYAARIQRAIDKTTAELKEMQTARKAAYAKAEQEAILLTQLAAAKGKADEAAKHFPPDGDFGGFVYSLPEIARLIARAAALEEAASRIGLRPVPVA